jgi:hypothetical protein
MGAVQVGWSIPQAQSDILGYLGAASQGLERAVIGKRTPVLHCNTGCPQNGFVALFLRRFWRRGNWSMETVVAVFVDSD